MYWYSVKRILESRLRSILECNGWHDISGNRGRDWSLYERANKQIRCYVDACRHGFSQSIAGYWIKIEDPIMSGVKRRIKAEFVEGKCGSVVASFNEGLFLAKIAEIVKGTSKKE